MKRILFLLISLSVYQAAIAQDFYDLMTIQEIHITFDESNWDQIMKANKDAGSTERLIAPTVVLNGETFDSVGIRYKGNSTFNTFNAKNPMNIKLDYIKGKQDYDGHVTLKLSNGGLDPSFVREALSYEIALPSAWYDESIRLRIISPLVSNSPLTKWSFRIVRI